MFTTIWTMTRIEGVPAYPLPPHARRVFKGKLYEVWQWEQKLYDGSTTTFEGLRRFDYAYMIGVLPDRKIMLVHDEQPDRGPVLTPAGGKVEPGEEPMTAAQREFLEETGYEAEEVVPWHTYRPSGKIAYVAHAFIGRSIHRVHEPALEAGERIEPILFTFEEFLKLGQNPDLRDWVLRIRLLEAQLDPAARAALEHLLYG